METFEKIENSAESGVLPVPYLDKISSEMSDASNAVTNPENSSDKKVTVFKNESDELDKNFQMILDHTTGICTREIPKDTTCSLDLECSDEAQAVMNTETHINEAMTYFDQIQRQQQQIFENLATVSDSNSAVSTTLDRKIKQEVDDAGFECENESGEKSSPSFDQVCAAKRSKKRKCIKRSQKKGKPGKRQGMNKVAKSKVRKAKTVKDQIRKTKQVVNEIRLIKLEKVKEYGQKHSRKNEQLVCPRCGVNVKHWCNYWRHVRRHMREDKDKKDCNKLGSSIFKFLCDFCGKYYLEGHELKLHIMRHHTGERPYKCDIGNCEKAFLRSTLLKIHKNTVHFNIRRYQCKECLKMFKRKLSLNVHMKNQHVVSTQKTCHLCGEHFNQNVNLVYHLKAHTDPSILVCKICGKKYELKSTLVKHIQQHNTELKCNVCGEVFNRKSYLQEHQWKHTGQKEFQCPVCGKTFSQKGNMTVHMKTKHSDDAPSFFCPGCRKAFSVKSNMKVHMKRCKMMKLSAEEEESGEGEINEDDNTAKAANTGEEQTKS